MVLPSCGLVGREDEILGVAPRNDNSQTNGPGAMPSWSLRKDKKDDVGCETTAGVPGGCREECLSDRKPRPR
jgi:hypothetical protein